jgi:Na+-transporting methylmalonyl-CoA/oxaloacetate decarboxylase gamma subunit
MDQILKNFVETGTIFQKGVFLLIAGVLFVFAVQLVFYLTVKIWVRISKPKEDAPVA